MRKQTNHATDKPRELLRKRQKPCRRETSAGIEKCKAIDMNRVFIVSSNTTLFWLRFERESFWNSKKVAYSRCAHHLDILNFFFWEAAKSRKVGSLF